MEKDPDDACIEIMEKCGGPIFVHFDETASFVEGTAFYPGIEREFSVEIEKKLDEKSREEFRDKKMLEKYNTFFQYISPCLKLPNVFMIFTGRSTFFAKVARQISDGTNYFVGRIYLPPLGTEYIREIVDKLRGSGYRIPIESNMEATFCSQLFRASGGIPRLIERALVYLLTYGVKLEKDSDVELFLNKVYEDRIGNIARVGIVMHDESWKHAFSAMLLMGLFGLKVRGDRQWEVGSFLIYPVEVIDNCNLHYELFEEEKCKMYKVMVPTWVAKSSTKALGKIGLFINQYSIIPRLLSQGDLLEQLILGHLLVCTLLKEAKWSETFSFLKDTYAASEMVPDPTIVLVTLPKMVARGGRNEVPSEKDAPNTQISTSMWGDLYQELFRINTIGIFSPQSHSPDIAIRAKDLVICFACKMLTGTRFTWAQLRDEIKKTSPMIAGPVKHVVLVIASTAICVGMKNMIGNLPYLTLEENKNFDVSGKPMTNRETRIKPELFGFTVPKGMQVVILNSNGFEELVPTVYLNNALKLCKEKQRPVDASDIILNFRQVIAHQTTKPKSPELAPKIPKIPVDYDFLVKVLGEPEDDERKKKYEKCAGILHEQEIRTTADLAKWTVSELVADGIPRAWAAKLLKYIAAKN